MQVASPVSASFLKGFVGACVDAGLSQEDTEVLFQKHAYASWFGRPAVLQGFLDVWHKDSPKLCKSAAARLMTPDALATLLEAQLLYGDTLMAKEARAELGLPEPSWDSVPDHVKESAANLSGMLSQFQSLPMTQQVVLASLLGGTAGGVWRSLRPSDSDAAAGRGVFNRFARGALRGGATGAGIATGAAAGGEVTGRLAPDMRGSGAALGGALGGLAARRLTDDVIE